MKKNFRFFDNRQKYLLFVTTTNEKNKIADALKPIVQKIKPKFPALKIFDAGMGDGSLLMSVMRQCHQKMPHVPLLVSTKEISMEDVRLGLEKLPDRFVEHKNTVFVISNLNYVESTSLKSNNETKQKKMNWKVVKLIGNSSLDYANQLRRLNQEFLNKKWQIERNPKNGNPTYKEPSVIVIYRKDQEFSLKNIIPKKNDGKNSYNLIIASQPYRSRISAEKKVKYVIEPMLKSLDKKGKLVVVHACGKDPGNKIIKRIWPNEKPFPSLYNSILKYIKNNTDKDLLKTLKFNKKQTIKYVLRALPNEISGGIATSLIFSAWNAAVYVNQISDEQIMRAEGKKYYQKIVQQVVNNNKGLYFNNELFVIEKK
ncbi:hypothetical protein OA670_01375 [Candidatus Pelagibacter sp.]|nr:hypothetical protein [Candidatus Pelagibacter sp.]